MLLKNASFVKSGIEKCQLATVDSQPVLVHYPLEPHTHQRLKATSGN